MVCMKDRFFFFFFSLLKIHIGSIECSMESFVFKCALQLMLLLVLSWKQIENLPNLKAIFRVGF